MRIHRLVGMSCPFRFPVYERNLRETGNVSQQSQHDDKLLFIRVMSLTLRCSWHWLCRTHIHTQYTHTQRASGGQTLNGFYVNGLRTVQNGNVSLSTSFPLWTYIYIYIYIYIYTYIQAHTRLLELLIFSQRSLGLCLYHPSRK